ncbi:MAG: Ig-like domain-containing protein, partial [Clostridia bacterium]|nr:Ig-like domain-containing protein [Clostridia bacterium]
MKSNFSQRLLSLLMCMAMLVAMFSMLTGISAFAATQTTIIESLNPDDWNYTQEDGKFYFDNSSGSYYLYNVCQTTVNGKSIVTKNDVNLGTDFTATFRFGAKSANSNYPTNTDYGFAISIGEDLKIMLVHDSKWTSYFTENTTAATDMVRVKIFYKGAQVYSNPILTNKWANTGAGVNNNFSKSDFTLNYKDGFIELYKGTGTNKYHGVYVNNGDGTYTAGINLADLVDGFVADEVIFKDNKVTLTMICGSATDIYTLTKFTLSAVPAEDAQLVTSYIVASENDEYGYVVADAENPAEVYAGDKLTFTAVANEGYRFAGWYKPNGAVASASATATFSIFEGSEFYAHFVSLSDHTQVEKPNRVTILCLGDSITDGYCIASGYRSYLMKKLYSEGAYFDFAAGKYRDDDDVRLPVGYRNHGGLSGVGFKAYSNLGKAVSLLDSSMGVAKADMALIMLGTNDYSHYDDASDYIGDHYREYINTLLEQNPNLVIYCASVIPQKTGYAPASAEGAINEQLPEIVAEFKAAGHDVNFVDMANLANLTSDDFADGVHPNESGAEKMADVWYDAIVDKVFLLNSAGDSAYVAPAKVNGVEIKDKNHVVYLDDEETLQLYATVSPANAEMTTVNWTSADESVATIDNFGKIKAKKAGTVKFTATTVDGEFTDTVTVTVLEGANPDKAENLFVADFDDATKWIGSTALLNSSADNIFANYANKTHTISTADTYLADEYFRLHFNFRIYGNNTANHNGKYDEISYGGYTLRFGDCFRTLALYNNGTLLATVKSSATPDTVSNEFDLVYSNGTVSVYQNGFELASVENAPAPIESEITFNMNEIWRASFFSNVYLNGTAAKVECNHENTAETKENEVAADCTKGGSYVKVVTCTVCGEELSRETITVDALGHNEVVDEAVAPTLNSTGLTVGKHCSVCGAVLVAQDVVPMLVGEATFGGTNYATLEEAVANANDGDTILLTKDVELETSLRIAKKVTIDLNGKTITANFEDSYGAFYVAMAGDLTITGEGAINSTDIAIGVYGNLTVNGGTISGDYAAIYNFYYNASTYGTTAINGATVEGWVLNCGELTVEDGSVQWIDNSGALAVNGGAVEHIYGRDGSDAAGVEGAGTIAIADPSAIEVAEGYILLEVEEGIYVAHAHEWGDWEITTTATATVPGVKTRTCGVCGETETMEYTIETSGTTGEVTWRFENGTLYIEGNGAMEDYMNNGKTAPWLTVRTETTAIVIGDGVTYIGSRAFKGFNRVITATLGADVKNMGYECFYLCNKLQSITLNEG